MSAYATQSTSTNGRQPHRHYQQAQVETASPTRLVVLLYDGAIRFCSRALEAMEAKDLPAQNTNLIKAQKIVGELMASLNKETGGEVAGNLNRVYPYLLEQLVEANLHDRPDIVEGVLALLRDLRESWAEVDRLAAGGQATNNNRPATSAPATLGEQRA